MISCGNGLNLIDLVIDRYRLLIDELSLPRGLCLFYFFLPIQSSELRFQPNYSVHSRNAIAIPEKNRKPIQFLDTCTVHSTNTYKRVSPSPIRATHVTEKIGKNRGLEFEVIHRQVPLRTESSIVDRPCSRRSGSLWSGERTRVRAIGAAISRTREGRGGKKKARTAIG